MLVMPETLAVRFRHGSVSAQSFGTAQLGVSQWSTSAPALVPETIVFGTTRPD
jgi:hypothetical protein